MVPRSGTATPKLRWTLLEERQPGKTAVPATATCGGHTWAIQQADGGWTVVHTSTTGKKATLTPKPVSYGAAYQMCVDAARKVA
jgi:hypothetical protein